MQITIQGEITADLATEVVSQIAASGADLITVRINSQGGSVQAGVTIYEALKVHPAGVTVEITGWALSVASLIAMAGNPIRMAETSLMMLHAPWTTSSGNAAEFRETAQTLDAVARSMHAAYARTRQSDSVIRKWLTSGEHWFTASEAIHAGLADEIITTPEAAPVTAMACAFEIPPHILEHIRMSQVRTPTPATIPQPTPATVPNLDPQAAARLADLERREAIRNELSLCVGKMEGSHRFIEAVLRDPQATVESARRDALRFMAQDVEPVGGISSAMADMYLNGTYNRNPCEGSRYRTGDQRTEFLAAATDAILARAGHRVDNPHPAARDLRGKSIAFLAERLLSMDGRSTAGLTAAESIKAAMTRSDLPQLLEAVTARSLREAYESAPSSHAIWTAERDVADFRPQTLLQMSEAPELEQVGELAEYTFGSFSEAAESFQIETFGRIIRVSRQALVNDDLGAFTRVPAALGAAARRLEADRVYAKLTANPTLADGVALFHADHGNLAATPAELDVESLADARAAMRKQRTLNGLGFLDITPRYLLVPTALETEAESLLASLARPDGAHSGASNPAWIRGLELVSDPRLDANSETAWYLAADPRQIETVLRAYLAGTMRPDLIEDEEFGRDAYSWKARLDFGVGVIDYRGLFKNAGA